MPRIVKAGTAALYQSIREVLEQARASAYHAVNFAMVQAYWRVGYLIVEHEQGGKKRAEYGEALLGDLSRRLTREYGRGYTTTNLRYMRQFYLAFPIHHAVRDKSVHGRKRRAVRSETPLTDAGIHHAASDESMRPRAFH